MTLQGSHWSGRGWDSSCNCRNRLGAGVVLAGGAGAGDEGGAGRGADDATKASGSSWAFHAAVVCNPCV